MVARLRTTNRTSLLSAPSLTAMLLRKSRRKYVTEVLNQEKYLGCRVEVETADHQPFSQHDDDNLPQLSSPFSDSFLRVPGNYQQDPITPRSPHSSSGAATATRQNPPYILPQSASHLIYLNGHLNPSSCSSSRYPTSSLVSRYHSAASFYSLAESDFAFQSTYDDDDVCFHSAQQSFVDSYFQPVLSKDYASSPLHHIDHSDPANSSVGAEHKSPNVGDSSQGTDSSKDALSSPEDSTDKSFQCRGLTSSQITRSSRDHPSDQDRSQPSDSQPNDQGAPQSNDQRRFNSNRNGDGDGEVGRMITDSQGLIDCCNESSRIPAPTGEADSPLASNQDHHSGKEPDHDAFELTRKKVSNSQDEVAIKPIKQGSSHSSQNSSSATAVIPSKINLNENASIFKCPFLRRMLANFGPGLIAWNDKRKKFQEELQAKIRVKLQNNLNKTAKTTP